MTMVWPPRDRKGVHRCNHPSVALLEAPSAPSNPPRNQWLRLRVGGDAVTVNSWFDKFCIGLAEAQNGLYLLQKLKSDNLLPQLRHRSLRQVKRGTQFKTIRFQEFSGGKTR